jgi:hypothetical protein
MSLLLLSQQEQMLQAEAFPAKHFDLDTLCEFHGIS